MTREQLAAIDALLEEKHFTRSDLRRFFQFNFDLKDYDMVPAVYAEKLIRRLKQSRNKESMEKAELRRDERNALYREMIAFARSHGLTVRDGESVYAIHTQLIRAGFKMPKEYVLSTD
jgi:hypothetical protein